MERKKALQDILRIRREHLDVIYFYGNVAADYYYIEENPYIPEAIMNSDQNFLRQMYNGTWVEPQDRGKIINLYERLIQGTKEPIHMRELSAEIYVNSDIYDVELVSIVCYLDLDESGLIQAYVGKVKALRDKELEDREILMSFTNDKNPMIFIKRIARFMEAQPERQYAFIQFDIRKFRYINDTYGTEVGDEILKYISDTLDVMCDSDHLHCRLSADLFQIVTYYNSREDIIEFIEALDKRLQRCGDVRFSMVYGISIAPGTTKAYRDCGDKAGLARMQSKNSVLKKYLFYEEIMQNDLVNTAAIEEAEEEALENGEFIVYLQPKFTYDRQQARIVGAEALVRWIDADHNFKSPIDFIPIFEKNGFILKLDQFMWESVCKILRRWLDEGRTPVPISVNVSRTYLKKVKVVDYLKELVERYQIPIELLQLEITETTESEDTLAYANDFKEAGFTLLMDDFGSGYSSLSMLKDTPFDVLKMDRFFLDQCLENEQGKTIVSHVISMSSDLGLDIIAEGVETKEQADFLYDNGCEVSQGYYFSRPISVEEFDKLLEVNEN